MPYIDTPITGAGTTLAYEDPATPDTFIELPNVLTLGQTGEQAEAVDVTPLSALARSYVKGLLTPPDKQLSFNHVPGEADYAAFLALVDGDENIRMRETFRSGDTVIFTMLPLGKMLDEPEGNTQIKMQVFGKQVGRAVFSETPAP